MPAANSSAFAKSEMRGIRGNSISMIFQEPMTSLDPVMRVGKQIAESLVQHQGLSGNAARARAIEMLRARPHSGGGAAR